MPISKPVTRMLAKVNQTIITSENCMRSRAKYSHSFRDTKVYKTMGKKEANHDFIFALTLNP